MANDPTAKTTNSTTCDNRYRHEHEIQENIVANEPTVNANNKLPSPSMSNDHTNVLATKCTSHISFDKLIELIDSESKRIREWNTRSSIDAMRLMRLCGGGEQGINNGTTGWGSPPTAPSAAPGKCQWAAIYLFIYYLEYHLRIEYTFESKNIYIPFLFRWKQCKYQYMGHNSTTAAAVGSTKRLKCAGQCECNQC